jgi:hypothetical protein
LHSHVCHLVADGVIAVTDEPIRTRSNEKPCLEICRLGKQFIDFALAIPDADAALGLGDQVA